MVIVDSDKRFVYIYIISLLHIPPTYLSLYSYHRSEKIFSIYSHSCWPWTNNNNIVRVCNKWISVLCVNTIVMHCPRDEWFFRTRWRSIMYYSLYGEFFSSPSGRFMHSAAGVNRNEYGSRHSGKARI